MDGAAKTDTFFAVRRDAAQIVGQEVGIKRLREDVAAELAHDVHLKLQSILQVCSVLV